MTERARSWNLALAANPGPLDLRVGAEHIDGRVPEALFGGRLLSNGPGWNVIGGMTLHPFDGHGYVRAFSFERDGAVRLLARHVETPAFVKERASGRIEVRGLATNLEGPFWRNMTLGPARNVANTTVFRQGDRLLAGWEGGAPWAVDAHTLETRGEDTLGGALAGQATLAHFKRDAVKGRLVACSVKMGRSAGFVFREFDADERLVSTTAAAFDGMHFAHDFALSARWYVLGSNPLRAKVLEFARTLLGRSTLLRSIETDREAPPALLLVPRGGGAPRTVRLPGPGWVVHFGNAFERADGALVIDASVFHRFEFGEEFGYQGPHAPFDPTRPEARGPQTLYRITVAAGASEATWAPLCPHGVDFPRVHPEHEGVETPALFGATRADTRYSDPFDSVIRVDLRDPQRPPALWTTRESTFVGEPIFAPDPARPDAGHVLVLVSDGVGARTSLVVLDASALERGPVAVVPLPLLPVAFHGDWDARDQR